MTPEEAALPDLLDAVIHERYEYARSQLAHLSQSELRVLKGLLFDAEWVVGQVIDASATRRLGPKPSDWTNDGR